MDEPTIGEQVAAEMNPMGAQISAPADLPPLPEVTTRRTTSALPPPVTLPPALQAIQAAYAVLIQRGLIKSQADARAAWQALSTLQEQGASNMQLIEMARQADSLAALAKEAKTDG
jgi:hypothetical protein